MSCIASSQIYCQHKAIMAGVSNKNDWRNTNPFARKFAWEQLGLILDSTELPETSPEGHKLYFITIVDAPPESVVKKPTEEGNLHPWSDIGSESDSDSEEVCDKLKSVSSLCVQMPLKRNCSKKQPNFSGQSACQHTSQAKDGKVTQTQVK